VNPSETSKPSATASPVDLDDPVAAALCLSLVPGIGPVTCRNLVDHFGSPAAVLRAEPARLREVDGTGVKLTRAIASAAETIDIESELTRCRQHNLRLIPRERSDYPRRLAEIRDAPAVLYCRGTIETVDELAIAIVGSRHATSYGIRQAERLAHGLAMAGFTIVSGLARGIDSAAHRGALAAGGRTIAVLGSGLLNLYPPENAELSLEIAANGAVISEYPTLLPPKSGAFPQRNRIVTGMSLGLIVIEAADRSGALISARLANEQGREVFALPGPADSRMSSGCHRLIRDGAVLVTCVDDVLEGLGPMGTPMRTATAQGKETVMNRPMEIMLNEVEQNVLQSISTIATDVDEVIAACGLPVHQVLAALSVLEMRHLVKRVPGNRVFRC
jgi:DNA processing protein